MTQLQHRSPENYILLIKYIVRTILIEVTNLRRIKCLNIRFSKYQKQPFVGVL